MKRIVAAVLFAVFPLGAQYYYTDTIGWFDPAKWYYNGVLTRPSYGVSTWSAAGGSLVSKTAVPDGTSDYEVRMTLALNIWGSGGKFAILLRATSDARPGPTAAGTYYSVELQNPTFNGSVCTANVAIYRRSGGVVTLLGQAPSTCRNGMAIRAIRSASRIDVLVDDVYITGVFDATITAGQPGVAVYGAPPTYCGITSVSFGLLDHVPPSPVDPQSVGVSAAPNTVDLQWRGVLDNPDGAGFWRYLIYRDGAYVGETRSPELSDASVQPSTTYHYELYASDYHSSVAAPASVTVTTPPAGSIDPRRVGVRPNGAYWGAAGEQIDVRSGNLNFTLPLLKAMGRGGWGVSFALSYNS
jgi:hypothetical protein